MTYQQQPSGRNTPPPIHSSTSWNPLPKGTNDSLSDIGNVNSQNGLKTASKGSLHPRRNLYVNSATTMSMDCPPTISVERCSDDNDDQIPPTSLRPYLKRHSTGDAVALIGDLRGQGKLQEAANNSTRDSVKFQISDSSSSLGTSKGAAITDF